MTALGQPLDVSVAIVNAGDSAVRFTSASLVAVDGCDKLLDAMNKLQG